MIPKLIAKELKKLLLSHFGTIIENVILFGSRAKRKTDNNSDYDILVILNKDYDWKFEKEIQDICWEIDYKYEILTDVKIISIDELNQIRGKQPYILNALNEGMAV